MAGIADRVGGAVCLSSKWIPPADGGVFAASARTKDRESPSGRDYRQMEIGGRPALSPSPSRGSDLSNNARVRTLPLNSWITSRLWNERKVCKCPLGYCPGTTERTPVSESIDDNSPKYQITIFYIGLNRAEESVLWCWEYNKGRAMGCPERWGPCGSSSTVLLRRRRSLTRAKKQYPVHSAHKILRQRVAGTNILACRVKNYSVSIHHHSPLGTGPREPRSGWRNCRITCIWMRLLPQGYTSPKHSSNRRQRPILHVLRIYSSLRVP